MNHSIKLENIGCLTTESASGFDYKNNTSLVLEGDCIKSIGSGNGDTTLKYQYKLRVSYLQRNQSGIFD